MTSAQNLAGAGLLIAAAAGFVLLVELWTRRVHPNPEWSRKILHLGGLIPCLAAPLVITSNGVALVLSVVAAIALARNERTGTLQSVARVQRPTEGTAYYPIAVFLVFVLSAGRMWMYISALCALCVADAVATLVGTSFGKVRFDVEDESKSLEGSLGFFLVTFAAVLVPLLAMTELPWPNCLLAALLTALLVTGFEAVSLYGFDNLFVPVGVCIILDQIVDSAWANLFALNLYLLAVSGTFVLLAWGTRQLDMGAALVFALFTYTAAALADWKWTLAPLSALALYVVVRLAFPPAPGYRTRVKVVVIARAFLPALLVLAFANAAGAHAQLQGPYVTCLAVTVCFGLRMYLARRGIGSSPLHPVVLLVGGGVIAFAVAVLPWAVQGMPMTALIGTLAWCAFMSLLHESTVPRHLPTDTTDFWTAPRFLLVCFAGLGVVVLQWQGLLPMWPDIEPLDWSI